MSFNLEAVFQLLRLNMETAVQGNKVIMAQKIASIDCLQLPFLG